LFQFFLQTTVSKSKDLSLERYSMKNFLIDDSSMFWKKVTYLLNNVCRTEFIHLFVHFEFKFVIKRRNAQLRLHFFIIWKRKIQVAQCTATVCIIILRVLFFTCSRFCLTGCERILKRKKRIYFTCWMYTCLSTRITNTSQIILSLHFIQLSF
jgi:hypothetical protein